ncbi:MAG: ABC transporter permease [Gemmatimonadales bacterium]|nr:ABC transporter permease [Gemmatimonadales bacterium]
MIIGETLKVALSSIRANKLRAALTMLGIIIGVGAVIAVVALGTGAQKAVEDRINALGANVLSVFPGQSFFGGRSSDVRVSLTVDDYEALRRDATQIAGVVPELSRNMTVGYGSQNLNVSIVGTTPNFLSVKNFTIQYGEMFSTGDDGARQRYAVLGNAIPEMLNVNPAALLKQQISVGGQTFEVIGVLAKKGAAMSFMNPDEQILIPLSTARYRLMGTDRLRQISLQVRPDTPLERGMVDIERILRREHKIRPGGDNDFQIRNQQDILATQQQATQVFGVLLASIAAVSLIVGGIGIMNIMLVSVTERTREIGVRRALGATKLNIMSQFLIEAVVLCLMGGMFGVILGSASARAMSKFLGWNTLISPTAVAVAFAFSALVGLFFGLWPARRAANLNTIDALRYE